MNTNERTTNGMFVTVEIQEKIYYLRCHHFRSIFPHLQN